MLGILNVQADIITFGKVIGAGMPVGAFASSKEIMGHLSPEGKVYQAGTLSGNPVDLTKHTLLCEYNNIENLKKCFEDSNDIACIIIEPIAGNMGLVPASDEFLTTCRELCDKNGALLIFDEVMTGFRASLKGASGILNVQADIITFGKVIDRKSVV